MTTLKVNETVTFEFKNDKDMIDTIATFSISRIEEKRIYLNLIENGKIDRYPLAIGYTKFDIWMKKYKI